MRFRRTRFNSFRRRLNESDKELNLYDVFQQHSKEVEPVLSDWFIGAKPKNDSPFAKMFAGLTRSLGDIYQYRGFRQLASDWAGSEYSKYFGRDTDRYRELVELHRRDAYDLEQAIMKTKRLDDNSAYQKLKKFIKANETMGFTPADDVTAMNKAEYYDDVKELLDLFLQARKALVSTVTNYDKAFGEFIAMYDKRVADARKLRKRKYLSLDFHKEWQVKIEEVASKTAKLPELLDPVINMLEDMLARIRKV